MNKLKITVRIWSMSIGMKHARTVKGFYGSLDLNYGTNIDSVTILTNKYCYTYTPSASKGILFEKNDYKKFKGYSPGLEYFKVSNNYAGDFYYRYIESSKTKLNYIKIPMMANWKFGNDMNKIQPILGLGLYFSYLVSFNIHSYFNDTYNKVPNQEENVEISKAKEHFYHGAIIYMAFGAITSTMISEHRLYHSFDFGFNGYLGLKLIISKNLSITLSLNFTRGLSHIFVQRI